MLGCYDVQLAACVDMSVELSEAALSFIRYAIEAAAAKAQARTPSHHFLDVALPLSIPL